MTAISFTIGDEIKNENVTPSGMPASIKPMNTGTAEHEQKVLLCQGAQQGYFRTIREFFLPREFFCFLGREETTDN